MEIKEQKETKIKREKVKKIIDIIVRKSKGKNWRN